MINVNKAVVILNELLILDPVTITLLAGVRVTWYDRFATDTGILTSKGTPNIIYLLHQL